MTIAKQIPRPRMPWPQVTLYDLFVRRSDGKLFLIDSLGRNRRDPNDIQRIVMLAEDGERVEFDTYQEVDQHFENDNYPDSKGAAARTLLERLLPNLKFSMRPVMNHGNSTIHVDTCFTVKIESPPEHTADSQAFNDVVAIAAGNLARLLVNAALEKREKKA